MAYSAQSKQYKFYSDPGHGWLEVTTADLADVGLHRGDFSRYSYQSGNNGTATLIYLEEDCDAPRFIAAFRSTYSEEPTIIERNDGAFIRNLRHLVEAR